VKIEGTLDNLGSQRLRESQRNTNALRLSVAKARGAHLHENGSWLVTSDAVRLAVPLMLAI
jgi:hypothetical protein